MCVSVRCTLGGIYCVKKKESGAKKKNGETEQAEKRGKDKDFNSVVNLNKDKISFDSFRFLAK